MAGQKNSRGRRSCWRARVELGAAQWGALSVGVARGRWRAAVVQRLVAGEGQNWWRKVKLGRELAERCGARRWRRGLWAKLERGGLAIAAGGARVKGKEGKGKSRAAGKKERKKEGKKERKKRKEKENQMWKI